MPIASPVAERCAPDRSTLEHRQIDHVVVIGANGTMGYGSAALFTQAVPKVTFLARTTAKASEGLAAAIAQVRSNTVARRAAVGNYDDDLASALASADLVFEAVAEDPQIKREMFDRIEAHRRPGSIVATVSSGLSINGLAAGRSPDFRANFCGLHFFNPPNVITGTELIPNTDTDPGVLDFLEAFGRFRLGREMVRTADTPAFAGNRVGFKLLNECAQLAQELGPLLVDRLIGPYTGRALTPLATIDLVGWDVHQAIVDNVHRNARPADGADAAALSAHETLRLPTYMAGLIEQGVLGNKAGRGFFSTDASGETTVLVPETGDYVPQGSVELPELSFIDDIACFYSQARYREGMRCFLEAAGPHAAIARRIVAGYIAYAFDLAGEICEDVDAIDRIMATGFNWAPPSVLVDLMGRAQTIALMNEANLPVPALISDAAPDQRFSQQPSTMSGRFFVAG